MIFISLLTNNNKQAEYIKLAYHKNYGILMEETRNGPYKLFDSDVFCLNFLHGNREENKLGSRVYG